METIKPNLKRCVLSGLFMSYISIMASFLGIFTSKLIFKDSLRTLPFLFISFVLVGILLGLFFGWRYLKDMQINFLTETISQGKHRVLIKRSKIVSKRNGIHFIDDQNDIVSCTTGYFDRDSINKFEQLIKGRSSI